MPCSSLIRSFGYILIPPTTLYDFDQSPPPPSTPLSPNHDEFLSLRNEVIGLFSMISYSFKSSKNLNQLTMGCQQHPLPNHKHIFPSRTFIIYISVSLDQPFLKSFTKWILRGKKTNERLKGISCLNALILLMPGHHGCYPSVHYQGNWDLSLALDPGLSQKTSREGLSGYRRNVFLLDADPWRLRQPQPKRGLV